MCWQATSTLRSYGFRSPSMRTTCVFSRTLPSLRYQLRSSPIRGGDHSCNSRRFRNGLAFAPTLWRVVSDDPASAVPSERRTEAPQREYAQSDERHQNDPLRDRERRLGAFWGQRMQRGYFEEQLDHEHEHIQIKAGHRTDHIN